MEPSTLGRSRRKPVQKYHDRLADRYDRVYDDPYWRWHDAITWTHLKRFLPSNPSAHALDLGCGTGRWGLKLLQSGFPVTFVDISPRMLDQARAKVEQVGQSHRATFVQADLTDLTALPTDRFAFAVALGEPIGTTASPPTALKQIRRTLADDGVLVASFDNRLACVDFYLERGDLDELGRFLRNGRTHWLTRDPDEQFDVFTYTPSQLKTLLERCGLPLIDMIGKTLLPMRRFRSMLDSPDARRRLTRIEQTLARDPSALARANHLQIAARKPKPPAP